jgi:hypothetical protein
MLPLKPQRFGQNPKRLAERKAVTFISAFRCEGGIVLGTDSQETVGDYKVQTDKLIPTTIGKYEVAICGAGFGDLVDDLCEQIQEWISDWDLLSERQIIQTLRTKVREFYKDSVAAYPDPDATQKRLRILVCLRAVADGDPMLIELRATTVRKARNITLLGWDEPILNHFASRLYREGMPISQGVLLTMYLCSIAGSTVLYVDEETRIVIASRNKGIRTHEPLFVQKIAQNIEAFRGLIDKLTISLPDTSLSDADFDRIVDEFVSTAKHLRKTYIFELSALSVVHQITTTNYPGTAYPMFSHGTKITMTTNAEIKGIKKDEESK